MFFPFVLSLCIEDRLLLVQDRDQISKKICIKDSQGKKVRNIKKVFSTPSIEKLKAEHKQEIRERRITGITQEVLAALKKSHLRQLRKTQLLEINRLLMLIGYAARNNFAVGDVSSNIIKSSKYSVTHTKSIRGRKKKTKKVLGFMPWHVNSRILHLQVMLKLVGIIRKQSLQLFPTLGCKNILIEVERGVEGVKRLIQVYLEDAEQQQKSVAFKTKPLGLSTTFYPDIPKVILKTIPVSDEQAVLRLLDRIAELLHRRKPSEKLSKREQLLIEKEGLLRAGAVAICKKREALRKQAAYKQEERQLLKNLRSLEGGKASLSTLMPTPFFKILSEEYGDIEGSFSESEEDRREGEGSSTLISPQVSVIQPQIISLPTNRSRVLGKRHADVLKTTSFKKRKKAARSMPQHTEEVDSLNRSLIECEPGPSSLEPLSSLTLLSTKDSDIERSSDEEDGSFLEGQEEESIAPAISAITPFPVSSSIGTILMKSNERKALISAVETTKKKDASSSIQVLCKKEETKREDEIVNLGMTGGLCKKIGKGFTLSLFYIQRTKSAFGPLFTPFYTTRSGMTNYTMFNVTSTVGNAIQSNLEYVREILSSDPFFEWKEPFSQDSIIRLKREDALRVIWQGLQDMRYYFSSYHPDILIRSGKIELALKEAIVLLERQFAKVPIFNPSGILKRLEDEKVKELTIKYESKNNPLKRASNYHPTMIVYWRGVYAYMAIVVKEGRRKTNLHNHLRHAIIKTLKHVNKLITEGCNSIKIVSRDAQETETLTPKQFWPMILSGLKEMYSYYKENAAEVLGLYKGRSLKKMLEDTIHKVELHTKGYDHTNVVTDSLKNVLEAYEREREPVEQSEMLLSKKKKKSSDGEERLYSTISQLLGKSMKGLQAQERLGSAILPFLGIYKLARSPNTYKVCYRVRTCLAPDDVKRKVARAIDKSCDLLKIILDADQEIIEQGSAAGKMSSQLLFLWMPLDRDPLKRGKSIRISLEEVLPLILQGFQETLAYAKLPRREKTGCTITQQAQVRLEEAIKQLQKRLGKGFFVPSNVMEKLISDFLRKKTMIAAKGGNQNEDSLMYSSEEEDFGEDL